MSAAIQALRASAHEVSDRKHKFIMLAVVIFAAATLFAFLPSRAYADIFGDILGINSWITQLFCDMANGMLSWIFSFLQSITASDLLIGSFQDLFGSGSSALFRFATDICNGIIKPIGGTVLALIMLMQLIKISQRVDASATLPGVKEILLLVVMYTIFSFLISNADKLCAAIYEVVNTISLYINNYNPSWSDTLGSIQFITPSDVDSVSVGDALALVIIAIICFLLSAVAYVVAFVMALARNLQLYMCMTFAPIPIALLGFDETRSMGIGYLKNFASVCLAGTLMVFILMAFPFVAASVIDFSGDAVSNALGLSMLLNILKVAGVCLLLVFALIKSGSTARDILGG